MFNNDSAFPDVVAVQAALDRIGGRADRVRLPGTGPGGSANCDAASSEVWAQTFGLFQSFARLRVDPSRLNYPEGETSSILWNVAESGCGSAPVTIRNRATATLHTYTPYQPNAASLAAYPGMGDACSSYGNRNFFRLFTEYFGSTRRRQSHRRHGPRQRIRRHHPRQRLREPGYGRPDHQGTQ